MGRARRALPLLVAAALVTGGCGRGAEPTPTTTPTVGRHDVRVDLGPGQSFGFRVGAPGTTGQDLDAFKRDVDRLAALGAAWIRYDIPSWLVAPSGEVGSVAWDEKALQLQQQALSYAKSRHLRVMLVVSGAPDWSQPFDHGDYVDACRSYWGGLRDALSESVDIWQVFNEADSTDFRHFTRAEVTDTYLHELSDLLGTASDVFGSGSHPLPITTNVTGWPVDDATERRWFAYFQAVAPHLEILAVDAYPGVDVKLARELPARLERLRRRWGKPVVVAEFGLQTARGTSTPAQQAQAYHLILPILRRSNAPVVIAYELRDTTSAHSPQGFGVLHADGTPKPSYSALVTGLALTRF